jgi:hypothetical protein
MATTVWPQREWIPSKMLGPGNDQNKMVQPGTKRHYEKREEMAKQKRRDCGKIRYLRFFVHQPTSWKQKILNIRYLSDFFFLYYF